MCQSSLRIAYSTFENKWLASPPSRLGAQKYAQQSYYLIAQSDWNELIILREPAVKPLIKALDYEFYSGHAGKATEALGNIGGPIACEALFQL